MQGRMAEFELTKNEFYFFFYAESGFAVQIAQDMIQEVINGKDTDDVVKSFAEGDVE